MVESRHPDETEGALFLDDDAAEASDPMCSADDGKAERSQQVLEGILGHMGLTTHITLRENGERVVLDVQGADAGRVIGKKGQTLDAIQFLVNKIVNRQPEARRHVIVDSGNYRERRDNGLVSMARREARRAIQQSRVITLEPMSPRDRRVIHLSLAKLPGVSTRSDGEGMERRVRIIPSRVRPRRSPARR
ncbi:MAG: KH domain-containing protein [Proteobacteria bacterium]|nr:KH domain-containing protein [Pseudomonadota bacterium]